MKNKVQLITYVDRLAGDLGALTALLKGPLQGLFGGVHLLPFFTPIDGADAGFDPIDHRTIDPRLGDWGDLAELGQSVEVMADVIVNHISAGSPQFLDFTKHGAKSPYAGLILTYDRVFPQGATERDLLTLYRPRPGLPFTAMTLANGERRLLWTTFSPQQIDIDVTSPAGEEYLASVLDRFEQAGVKSIRLDAAGYAIKKAGTSCFMIPETFEFISKFAGEAERRKMEVLVEIHSHHALQIEIARRVDWVYDFALPPLVLYALIAGDPSGLRRWLEIRPANAVTVLDTHDGIGVIDVGADQEGRPGLLEPAAIDRLVETIHSNSRGESRKATGAAANNLDLYQVNCTYYDALGRDDRAYLIARAIQFFVPGIPQIYYVGLLAATNDMTLLEKSGVGRDINRHYFEPGEVEAALRRPVVQGLTGLIGLRNAHPAFDGDFSLGGDGAAALEFHWRAGEEWAKLEVDCLTREARITFSPIGAMPGGIINLS